MREPDRTFDLFAKEVLAELQGAARQKGYNDTGAEGSNILYELVLSAVPNNGHAVGEIIYKAVRYARRGDSEDLLKAAAWAFLAWRYHRDATTRLGCQLGHQARAQDSKPGAAESRPDPRQLELPLEP